ncbi:MAG: shikimate kinase [Planctomycetes bacterium]|nr:shikimate kinase [Planctomycetota bacterium]
MPGVGKSTVGVLLAKVTSRDFVDTDVVIQSREGRRLQDIIDTEGTAAFRKIEEQALLSLDLRRHVIATGGSVVYSERAMKHLGASGAIVHLDLPFDALERRITDLDSRGVVMEPGQTLRDLFDERQPLYRRYADATIDCTGLTHEQTVAAVVERQST